MNADWEKRLLLISKKREEPGNDREFINLVYKVENNCSLEAAKVLMKTFVDGDDLGTQESVNSVLATADPKVVTQALLEELPRLAKEAPEWAHYLIGIELKSRSKLLQEKLTQMPDLTKSIVKKIIENRRIIDSNSMYTDYSLYKQLVRNISEL